MEELIQKKIKEAEDVLQSGTIQIDYTEWLIAQEEDEEVKATFIVNNEKNKEQHARNEEQLGKFMTFLKEYNPEK